MNFSTGFHNLRVRGVGTSHGCLNPGDTVEGPLLFDVPKHFKPTRIVLHDSDFSDGVAVDLRGV